MWRRKWGHVRAYHWMMHVVLQQGFNISKRIHSSSGDVIGSNLGSSLQHKKKTWFLLLICQMHGIDSQSRRNLLAQNRHNSLPCTVRTQTKVVQLKRWLSVGGLLNLVSRVFGQKKRDWLALGILSWVVGDLT